MKKTAIALFTAALAVAVPSFARIAPDQIALGGVAPGMTIAQLAAAAGEPQNKAGDDWFYPQFKVEFDDDRPGVVESVSAYAPPAAISAVLAVGQPESAIVPALGTPDGKADCASTAPGNARMHPVRTKTAGAAAPSMPRPNRGFPSAGDGGIL